MENDSSQEDLINLEQILMKVDNLENTLSVPILGQTKVITTGGSAEELDDKRLVKK